MSGVLRPSGPLPARVYWTRRLLVLAVLVVVVSLLWWFFSSLGDASPGTNSGSSTGNNSGAGGNGGGQGGATSTSKNEDQTSSNTGNKTGGKHQPAKHDSGKNAGAKHNSGKPALAEPTGDCAPSDVAMAISVDDMSEGGSTKAVLSLTTSATPACTLAITPDALAIRVTSGTDVIWTSDDCPDSLLVKQVVVRADPPTTYTFNWDGRRSIDGCSAPGLAAAPGGYWVEAAFIGGDVTKAYFDIT